MRGVVIGVEQDCFVIVSDGALEIAHSIVSHPAVIVGEGIATIEPYRLAEIGHRTMVPAPRILREAAQVERVSVSAVDENRIRAVLECVLMESNRVVRAAAVE